MLSAENVALENRAVRLMLQIREKELNYITSKYNAMGTQAALVGGFTVTTLTSLSIGTHTPLFIRWMFFGFSSISLACSISCILNATFVTVWGPGLALRGPRGSMAKAYFGMVNEQGQIFGSFVTALLFFSLQSIVAFWIIDSEDSDDDDSEYYSWFATVVMLGGGGFAVYALMRMHERFHNVSDDDEQYPISLTKEMTIGNGNGARLSEDREIKEARKQMQQSEGLGIFGGNNGNGEQGGIQDSLFYKKLMQFSLMNGGLSKEEIQKSITVDRSSPIPDVDTTPSNFHGYLSKKSHHKGNLQYLQRDSWNVRFFVLDEGRLVYYQNEEEWKSGRPPRSANPISMGNYEVMVNPKDSDWGFMLESVGSLDRDWSLRAENEHLRLAWIKVLLKSSLAAESNRASEVDEIADYDKNSSLSERGGSQSDKIPLVPRDQKKTPQTAPLTPQERLSVRDSRGGFGQQTQL